MAGREAPSLDLPEQLMPQTPTTRVGTCAKANPSVCRATGQAGAKAKPVSLPCSWIGRCKRA